MKKLTAIVAPAFRLFRAGLDRFGAGGWAVVLLLIAGVAGFAGLLIFGENPWDRRVPEKLDNDQRLSIRDVIVCGLWLASLINLILALGLLALVKFWGRRRSSVSASPISIPAAPGTRRVFWIAVLLAVAAGAWVRAPRLNHSFWNDEEQAFRKFTWGQCVLAEKDGKTELEFHPTGWDRAFFYSINGNNHLIHTVAAKTGHEIWRAFSGSRPETFSETIIRIEPFLNSLLTIALIGLWLRALRFPVAGAVASWLLALHPWHVRYSVEARGYSALLLFVILAFLFLRLALRDNRWRWWLAFGAAQCLFLLSFAGAVYLAAAMNLVVAGILILRRDSFGFWRWAVACMLGAMAFLQLMMPAVFRLIAWSEAPNLPPAEVGDAFYRDFWAHLTLGVRWAGANPDLHHFISFRELADLGFLRAAGMKWVLPLVFAVGAGFGFWKNRELRLFFSAMAAAAGLIVLHNTLSDPVFFVWYALYLILGFVVAVALVPEMAASIIGGKRPGAARIAVGSAALLTVAGYLWLAAIPLNRIRSFERHPMRRAVETVRGEAPAFGAEQAEILTASVGSGANQMRTYDPWIHWLKNGNDLEAVIAKARETGKPLAVYCCSPRQVRRQMPGLFKNLENRSLFDVETSGELKGLEEYWSFRIYRLRNRDETGG